MPKPYKNETQDNFIPRAIRYLVKNEGLEQKHAIAKAYGMWEQHLKRKHKKSVLKYD